MTPLTMRMAHLFGNALSGWHLVIILAIVLLLFGAPKLPALAKSVGQSMRIFRGEMKSMQKDAEDDGKGVGTMHSESRRGHEEPSSNAE